LGDTTVDRYNHREGNDDYTQAGDLYRLMTPEQQERLVKNIVGSLSQAKQDVQMRQLCHFFRADVSYGLSVAQGLGISIDPEMLNHSAEVAIF
jgi:catalase